MHQRLRRRSVERAIDVAERYDLQLGIEPEPSNVVSSAKVAQRLIAEVASSRIGIGIVIDAANLVGETLQASASARHDVIARAIDLLGDRIILVHAKDRRVDGTFVAPGQGDIDFVDYFGALAAWSVRVPVIAHGLAAMDAMRAADYLQECLEVSGLV